MSPLRAIALLAAAAALLPVACFTVRAPEQERHVLEVTRDESPLPPVGSGAPIAPRGALRIHRVRVSPLFSSNGFVYRRRETVYQSDFHRQFFAPPSTVLLLAVDAWLAESPLFTKTLRPVEAAQADWILEGSADALYVDLRGQPEAVIEIEFNLLDARAPQLGSLLRKAYAARTPVDGDSGEDIVRAWSQGLTEILRELEADLWRAVPEPAAEPTS